MTQARAHDPFSAHSRTSGGFPAARLSRAGVPDESVTNLHAWYSERSPEQQAEFRKSVNSASDTAISSRFVPPGGSLEEQLTADQLHDLALAAGVPTSGTKAEVAARIAEGRQQPASSPQEGAQGASGEQQAAEGAQEPQEGAQGGQEQAGEPQQPAEAALAADATGEPSRGEPQVAPTPDAAATAEELPAEEPARARRRGGSGKDGQ